MRRENWEQVKDIFNRALAVVPDKRAEFLTHSCADDRELRRDVETLLSSFDSTDSFLEAPAVGEFADLIDDEVSILRPGEIVTHYEIITLLGTGGMGEVYLAQDLVLNRRVALKFFHDETAEANIRKRFVREAQAIAAIEHPHICHIYEIAEANGQTFIAMQYIEGETLADRLKRKGATLAEAIEIAAQIADALTEAHSRGIIHRDIKPANVMLAARGGVKILDFGLAKMDAAKATGKGEFSASQKTTTPGLVMGTAAYMSPEQARGLPVDGGTDVWSLGVVLYEMVAGRLPFAGDTTSDIIAAILTAEPPLIDLPGGANRDLSSVIERSLAKDPAARYPSAAQMLMDLRNVQQHIDVIFDRTTVPNLIISGPAGVGPTDEMLAETSRKAVAGLANGAKKRRWLAAAGALAALVLTIAGFKFYTGNGSLAPGTNQPNAENKTNSIRNAVALVGFRDLSDRGDTAWLSPALVEMLSTELAAGEKLRIVPRESVERMKSEISITEPDHLSPDILQKVRANLDADVVVSGSYLVLNEAGVNRIRLDVGAHRAATGEIVAAVAESGSKAELFELVSRVGVRLREALGAGILNDADRDALRSSQPANAEAVRFYAEGRERLNNFDFLAARDLLERAVAADQHFSLSYLALSASLQKLGQDAKAKDAALRAFELSEPLRREERLSVEAFYREAIGERDKAIEIYSTLVDFFPDDLEYGLRLASTQTKGGHSSDALAVIENLRRLPAPVSGDPRIDIAEADAAEALSDYSRELNFARSAAEKGVARNASLLVAEARYYEGWALWNLGDNAAALTAHDEARRIYNEAGRRKSVADVLNAVATVHWKQGDYDKALRIYSECLAILRETGTTLGEAAALNNIANIYKDRDELTEARRYYEDALALEKEIGIKTRIGLVRFNLAGVLRMQGNLNESRKMYEDSLAIARETNRKAQITMNLQELAEILYYQNDLTQARALAEESLTVAREIKRRTSEAYTLTTLGRIAVAENDLGQAHQYLDESLNIRRDLGEDSALAESELFLSQLALAEGRHADAISGARKAVEVFAKDQAVSSEAEARATLALALFATGDQAAAETEIVSAARLANNGENKLAGFFVRISEARLLAATGRQAKAKQIFRKVASESNRLGFQNFAIEVRRHNV